LVEDDSSVYTEYQRTRDKARLDALREPDQRIDDWQARLDDH